MRLSVRLEDPGYRAYKTLPKNVVPIVRLDGMEIQGCYTADTKTGYVLTTECNDFGVLQVSTRRGTIRMKQLRGKVEIEIRAR